MVGTKEKAFTLVAVGDVSPNRDDPPSIFRHCGNVFKDADIVFGQMESPLTDKATPAYVPCSPSRLSAKNITALNEEGAGFNVMSFAANHATDQGPEGFFETLRVLKENNIAVVGAGRNIEEARRPAILERTGTRVGFLGYLSIVHPGLVACEDVPGCVPLRATHSYQQVHPSPGTPPLILTKLYPEDKQAMEEDIRKLRPQVDVVVVSIHCGVVYVPAMVAMYQKEAAYAAVDAGADLVLQHHAHILRGVEVYRGKVIFYGMGNFALEHTLPYPGRLRSWDDSHSEFRTKVCHVKRVPGYGKHIFSRDSLKTMIAKAYLKDRAIQKVNYIPAYITADLEPEVVTRQDPRAQEVFSYVKDISEYEDLSAQFSWDGDEVTIA